MKRATQTNALTKGVLDPLLAERMDLAHYYNGVRTGLNVQALPQGGFRRRAGTWSANGRRLRRRLEPVSLNAGMITAHNGGVTANLVDQDDTTVFTTSAVSTSPFVVAEIDLGAAQTLVAVDVIGFSTASGSVDDALAVEWWDGTSWISVSGADDLTLSPRRNIRTTARTRRFAERPGSSFTARNIRVTLYGAAGIGAVSVKGLRVIRETTERTPDWRELCIARSSEERYELVLTERNIDVFQQGAYMASLFVPVGADELAEVKWRASLDTLFGYHADIETMRIVRQGAADEWDGGVATWLNVPALEASTAFGSAQDEKQDIALPGLVVGQQLVIWMEGRVTAAITFAAEATLPAAIVAALDALPGIDGAGLTASLQSLSPLTVRVAFGGTNGGRRWPRMSAQVIGGGVAPVTTIVQRGIKASGLLMSAETGWPRSGIIVQSRHLLVGFRSAPQTGLLSVTGNPFDFDKGGTPLTADRAIEFTLDTDQVETLVDCYVGQHLLLYTEIGEWWVENRTFDATAALNIVAATRHGIDPTVPVTSDGEGVLFVQRSSLDTEYTSDGQILRDQQFQEAVNKNYDAKALSLLAPQLLADVTDIACRRATSLRAGSQVFAVNADGSMALLTLLRDQEVIALTKTTTDGAWRGVAVDLRGQAWMIAERTVAGVADLWQERWDPQCLLDAAVARAAVGAIVGDLGHLEGKSVYALVDGDMLGPFTVAGAAITLPAVPASAAVVVGLDFPVEVEPMPLREKLQNGQPWRAPVRTYRAELSLYETGGVAFGANGGEPEDITLRHFDGGPDPIEATGEEPANDWLGVPMMERLYTGQIIIDGLEGFERHPRWVIRQDRPAPLTVRALRLELSYAGG